MDPITTFSTLVAQDTLIVDFKKQRGYKMGRIVFLLFFLLNICYWTTSEEATGLTGSLV